MNIVYKYSYLIKNIKKITYVIVKNNYLKMEYHLI